MNIVDQRGFFRRLDSVLRKSLPENTEIHIGDNVSKKTPLGNSSHEVFSDGRRRVVIGRNTSECSECFPDEKISIDMKIVVQTVDTFHELHHYRQDIKYMNGDMHDTLYEDIVQTELPDFYKKAHNHDLFIKEIESDQAGVFEAFHFFESSSMAKKDPNFPKNMIRKYFEFKQISDSCMYNGKYLPKIDLDEFDKCSNVEVFVANAYSKMMESAKYGRMDTSGLDIVRKDGLTDRDDERLPVANHGDCCIQIRDIDRSEGIGRFINTIIVNSQMGKLETVYMDCLNYGRNDVRIKYLAAAVVAYNNYVNDLTVPNNHTAFLDKYPVLKQQNDFVKMCDMLYDKAKQQGYKIDSKYKAKNVSKVSHTISRKDIYDARVAEVDIFSISDDQDDDYLKLL